LSGVDAERHGLVWKCVDDGELMDAARGLAARAVAAPRALLIETKRTIRTMPSVSTHDEAVERELVPQVWSTRQPWFAERLAALQTKISKK
jgi:enoyl-CoA hydratase